MQAVHRQSIFGKSAPLLAIAALGLAAAPSAHAQTTLTDTNTLNGTFFYDPAANIVSISQAQAYIAANSSSPTGIFTASRSVLTNGGYSGGDLSTPQSFLGTDGASYLGTTTNLEDGIFDFKGYVDVQTAGTYNFATASDDGSALFIDGSPVVSNDGVAPDHFNQGNDTLSAGFHPIEMVYYNHVYYNIGGAQFAAGFAGLNVTSAKPLGLPDPASAAPEPSAIAVWALAALGAGGLVFKARRRRTVAA